MAFRPSAFAVLAASDPQQAQVKLSDLMDEYEGDIDEIADALGVSRRTVYRYLKRWEIR